MSWRGKPDPWEGIERDRWMAAYDQIIGDGGDPYTAITSTDPRNAEPPLEPGTPASACDGSAAGTCDPVSCERSGCRS